MGKNVMYKKVNTQKVVELGDINPEFENKIFTIADEVLNILKELSLDNQSEITSSQIAERMFWKESLTDLLNDIHAITEENKNESDSLKDLSNVLLDKFTELVPHYMNKKLYELKDALHNSELTGEPEDWIDGPIKAVKNYIDSISTRNTELEDFLNKTTDRLAASDECISEELTAQKQRYHEDIVFEKGITSNIDKIKQHINGLYDQENIKSVIFENLDIIHARVEEKRIKNMQYIKDTEKTIEAMNTHLSEIKREAGEITRKSKKENYEANHDTLTSAHNLKAFDKKMKDIFADVTRYNIKASLMICDIDLFKKINARCGHKVGDLGLRTIASIIMDRMRSNDFVARYGGEEFAVILPHTDLNEALMAGERLREYIDRVNFTYMEEVLPLTVSIGISCFRKTDSLESVIKRAESALIMAKKSGRNKVVTEDEAAVNR